MELDSNGTVPLRSPSLDRVAANSGALSMELDNAEIGAKPKGSAATAIMTHCGIQSKAIQELPDRTNGTVTNTGNAGSGSSTLSRSVAATLPQFSGQEEGAQPMQVYMVKQKYSSVERTEAAGDPRTAVGSSDTAENGKYISIPGLIERIMVLTGRSYDPPSGDRGFGAFSPRISRADSPSCLIPDFPLHNASAAMNGCIQDVNNVGLPVHLEGAETDPHGTDCLDPRRCTQGVCQNATMRAELNNGSQSF